MYRNVLSILWPSRSQCCKTCILDLVRIKKKFKRWNIIRNRRLSLCYETVECLSSDWYLSYQYKHNFMQTTSLVKDCHQKNQHFSTIDHFCGTTMKSLKLIGTPLFLHHSVLQIAAILLCIVLGQYIDNGKPTSDVKK